MELSLKKIETLVEDIYELFGSGVEADEEALDVFAENIKEAVRNALKKHEDKGVLRGSKIGEQCNRKTWYTIHEADKAEAIAPHVLYKFLYGHIAEELSLLLAKQSGHRVEATQHEVSVDGVHGHIDCIIDGTLVDVKSTTSRGIFNFRGNGLHGNDSFGYLDQIEFYKEGLQNDPVLEDKQRYAFLGVEREGGHLALDVYPGDRRDGQQVRENVRFKQQVVGNSDVPQRSYSSEPDGKSGNRKLAMKCNYCDFKKTCWADANDGQGLRTFNYSGYPRHLTQVKKLPNVEEIT